MKLIVGLGNPGREYAATRHNVGWWVVDHLAEAWEFGKWKKDGQALTASGRIAGQLVRLLKPQTYMNLSGAVLVQYRRRPSWHPESDLLVILDDVALAVGRIRIRAKGSAGGHNGLKSIEENLGTQEYPRMRIGIKPTHAVDDLSDFVLAPFARAETQVVRETVDRALDATEVWLRSGIAAAMNKHNGGGESPTSA